MRSCRVTATVDLSSTRTQSLINYCLELLFTAGVVVSLTVAALRLLLKFFTLNASLYYLSAMTVNTPSI